MEISGYFIAKGSTIITSMDSMNFNSKWNKDPEDFQPERFMQDTRTMAASANGKIEERDHISFGSGRRMCPGIYMVGVVWLLFISFYSYTFCKIGREGDLYCVCSPFCEMYHRT